jgi:hypothetical protein
MVKNKSLKKKKESMLKLKGKGKFGIKYKLKLNKKVIIIKNDMKIIAILLSRINK